MTMTSTVVNQIHGALYFSPLTVKILVIVSLEHTYTSTCCVAATIRRRTGVHDCVSEAGESVESMINLNLAIIILLLLPQQYPS